MPDVMNAKQPAAVLHISKPGAYNLSFEQRGFFDVQNRQV